MAIQDILQGLAQAGTIGVGQVGEQQRQLQQLKQSLMGEQLAHKRNVEYLEKQQAQQEKMWGKEQESAQKQAQDKMMWDVYLTTLPVYDKDTGKYASPSQLTPLQKKAVEYCGGKFGVSDVL